jgi:hypothetical protein
MRLPVTLLLLSCLAVAASATARIRDNELQPASHARQLVAPANDAFARRQVVSGAAGRVSGSAAGASVEGGEPNGTPRASSVWYKWTAPVSGTLVLSLRGIRGLPRSFRLTVFNDASSPAQLSRASVAPSDECFGANFGGGGGDACTIVRVVARQVFAWQVTTETPNAPEFQLEWSSGGEWSLRPAMAWLGT